VLAEWIRKVLALPDPIIKLGLPRDCGRVSKSARPEDAGWRRSDLGEGRPVRFATHARSSMKISAGGLEFKALSTPDRSAQDSRSGPSTRC
jgi:hypothetical protein